MVNGITQTAIERSRGSRNFGSCKVLEADIKPVKSVNDAKSGPLKYLKFLMSFEQLFRDINKQIYKMKFCIWLRVHFLTVLSS